MDLVLSEDESCIKIPSIPNELWTMILKYFATDPVLYNLCNVNSHFKSITDNSCLSKGVTLDVYKYAKLNKKRNIKQQVNYVINYRNHAVGSVIINRGVNADGGELVRPAIRSVLDRNPLQLKMFHYEVSKPILEDEEFIRDVVEHATSLTDVHIEKSYLNSPLNLSSLVNLRSLKLLTSYSGGGCYGLPDIGLTSLEIGQSKANGIDLKNLLVASKNTLVSLTMNDVTIVYHTGTNSAMTSLMFPNLKFITAVFAATWPCLDQCDFRIDLTESLLLESITARRVGRLVTGVDFRTHGSIGHVKTINDSINFRSFSMPTARLEQLESLEFERCEDLESTTAVLKRLACGCDQLEHIGLRETRLDDEGHPYELISHFIPNIIANNKRLRTFSFSYSPELFQSIIQAVVDTKNETFECIEVVDRWCYLDDAIIEWGNKLFDKLIECGYDRSKVLKIKLKRHRVPDDLWIKFLSRFNIDFTNN